MIARAWVWAPADIAARDLATGPIAPGGFTPGQSVRCRFTRLDPDGNSPKFKCLVPPSDEIKVKYGAGNGEVFGEVLATRLLWALGFGADRMYPVRVICEGCPVNIGEPSGREDERIVAPAAVERQVEGRPLPDDLAAWSWPDLERVDEQAGGAPRAQRDALKLLAVMLQHSDNKPEQQRLVCDDDECSRPLMMLNDVGLTFGRASFANDNARSSVNLQAWASVPVWKAGHGCIGNLPRSFTGTLRDPIIGEEGRAFLAGLLAQLTDAQLHDLFAGAQVERRQIAAAGDARAATAGDWVRVFRAKQAEIAGRRCPEDWTSQAPPLLGTDHVRWFQSWASPPLTIAMNAVSLLGYTRVYLFIALVIAVAVRFHTGVAILLVVALSAVLTDAAKTAASLPRPDAVDSGVRALSLTSHPELLPDAIARFVPGLGTDLHGAPSVDDEDSHGFPSGHVAAAMAFLLGLRVLAHWRLAAILAVVWVPLMAISRLYLGRHFAIDVAGGAVVGLLAVALGWRLRLHLLDHPVRGTNIALRMAAAAALVGLCALLLRMPAAADAGHLLGIAAAALIGVRVSGGLDQLSVGARVRRVMLATLVLGAAWWSVPAVIEAAGGSSRQGIGALMSGALPLFLALTASVLAGRARTLGRPLTHAGLRA